MISPDPLYIHRQSAYVVGRERKIAHVPIDHPSCSKQHAVRCASTMPLAPTLMVKKQTNNLYRLTLEKHVSGDSVS